MNRKQKYVVIGVANGGYNKTDNFPYITTHDWKKATKALAYCDLQFPQYEWRIRLVQR